VIISNARALASVEDAPNLFGDGAQPQTVIFLAAI
jgi:hypothetical protein